MSSEESETIEVDREELETALGQLRIAHDLFQNARGLLNKGERNLRSILDEDSERDDDDDDSGGAATTGYHGP
jgi:exonuclease VII small subunit